MITEKQARAIEAWLEIDIQPDQQTLADFYAAGYIYKTVDGEYHRTYKLEEALIAYQEAHSKSGLTELEQALNANAALQARVADLEALLQEAAQVIAPIADGVEYLRNREDDYLIGVNEPSSSFYSVDVDIYISDDELLRVEHLRAVATFAAKLAAPTTPQPDNYESVMCSRCGKWNTDCHCGE